MPQPVTPKDFEQRQSNPMVDYPMIGVSSCLLGHKVRYDGEHQFQPLISQYLLERFQLVHFCPEVAIGLGVPRPKIQLVERAGQILCLDEATGLIDYTPLLAGCCDSQHNWLAQICGYVLKTKSPSCGVTRVKTRYQSTLLPTGQGIFARELKIRFPDLPLIEEDELADTKLRATFIDKAICYHKARHT